jgi:phosphoribosylaminoimidazole-succinocarboxamide synthase
MLTAAAAYSHPAIATTIKKGDYPDWLQVRQTYHPWQKMIMDSVQTLYESQIPSLRLLGRGKVRDIYEIDDDRLLIVTTDRLSAYDVILPNPVPGKGEILTRISNFWFAMMADILPNHLTGAGVGTVVADPALAAQLANRAIVVKKMKPLPIEAVVRGYLIGSGWRDYEETGGVCGIALPSGLQLAEKLPEPLFTPATKAESGEHDENISFDKVRSLIGAELAESVRDATIAIYERAVAHAAERGIIIADTKFEFGLDDDGRLHVIDEMLTPDSSRFWPVSSYAVGISPPSFDKQFVRDYLDTLDWNHTAPGPVLPDDIVHRTAEKYREALRLLTS